jgi:hypothetical protein
MPRTNQRKFFMLDNGIVTTGIGFPGAIRNMAEAIKAL